MTTRLRSVHTHPTSRRTVLIGALTTLAQVAPGSPASAPTMHARARRNGKHSTAEIISAPPHVADMGRLLTASGALEVFYVRGAADIITGQDAHMLSLDPGCYLLARFPKDHEPMDGTVAVFTKQAEDRWGDEP
jgi:hypothetical protein